MFFVFFFSCRAENCNESSLDPGYVCCEDNPCKGRCVQIDIYENRSKKECITEIQYHVCYTGYMYPAIMLGFCIPTILFWVISCMTKTNVPLCTWITNIILNICLAAIVLSIPCLVIITGGVPLGFIIGGFSLFLGVYSFIRVAPCSGGPECGNDESFSDLVKENQMVNHTHTEAMAQSCPCYSSFCVSKPYDPFEINDEYCCGMTEDTALNTCDCVRFLRESRSPHVNRFELQMIIDENANLPPTPKSAGIAFYKTKAIYKVVQKEVEPIQYGSWQENGVIEKITKKKVIYRCNPHYIYHENMKEEIERANSAALEKVQNILSNQTSYDQFEFNGMTKRAIYGNTCTFNVCSTSCYNFFLSLIENSLVIENILWYIEGCML